MDRRHALKIAGDKLVEAYKTKTGIEDAHAKYAIAFQLMRDARHPARVGRHCMCVGCITLKDILP